MKGKVFHGGIHPPTFKELTSHKPIKKFLSPEKVFLPLIQHTGAALRPLVKKGDLVKRGQKIADIEAFVSAPLHSPIAGKITAIEEWPHPTRGKYLAIVVENNDSNEVETSEVLTSEDIEKIDLDDLRNWIR